MWKIISKMLSNVLRSRCGLLLPSSGSVFELQTLGANVESEGLTRPVQPIFLMHMLEILLYNINHTHINL